MNMDEVPCGSSSQGGEAYIARENLEVLPNPEQALDASQNELKSEDWRTQFIAINTLRSLAVHHSDYLRPALGEVLPSLLPCIDSLRSGLAKNAMMFFTDLTSCFPAEFPDIFHPTVSVLLLKSISEKKFLKDEAVSSLRSLSTNCASESLVAFLCASSETKNAEVVASATTVLENALSRLPQGALASLLPILLPVLSRLLEERRVETKAGSRKIVSNLSEQLTKPVFTQAVNDILPDERTRRVVLEVLDSSARPQSRSADFRAFLASKKKGGSTTESL